MATVSKITRTSAKDVWNIVYSGASPIAYTAIQFYNRSPHPMIVGAAFGNAMLADGDPAVDENGDLITPNITSVLIEETVSTGQGVYFNKSSGGTVIAEPGHQFAYAIHGDGQVDVVISAMEL